MTKLRSDTIVSGRGLLVRVEHRLIEAPPRRRKPVPTIKLEVPPQPASSLAGAVRRMLTGSPIRFPKELM